MIDQIGISLTGVTAIFLTQVKQESLRRYACLFGMAGQPFWFWSAISAKQWGIVFVTGLYTVAWAKGLYTYWLKPTTIPSVEQVTEVETPEHLQHVLGHQSECMYCGIDIDGDITGVCPVRARAAAADEKPRDRPLCYDCPPVGYPTDKTRCDECPRRAK